MKRLSLKIFSLFLAIFFAGTAQAQSVKETLNNLLNMELAESVDLGLSVAWANCNVGTNNPTECGKYFAWAEIEAKDFYEPLNYLYKNEAVTDQIHGSFRDAATMQWGSGWRMPTRTEIDELTYKCKWEWIERDGVMGNLVTGPNGNSIFLPAAGYINGGTKTRDGLEGFYWSGFALPGNNYAALILGFIKEAPRLTTSARYFGLPVRPVKEIIRVSEKNRPKGSGTQEDPYLIESAKHYRWFAKAVNSGMNYLHARLMRNIGNVTQVIGTVTVPFNGELDGNGHKVVLNILLSGVEGDSPLTGMFMNIGPQAYIHDMKVEGEITRRDFSEFELSPSHDKNLTMERKEVLFGKGPTSTVVAEKIPDGYKKGLAKDIAKGARVESVDVKVKLVNNKWP